MLLQHGPAYGCFPNPLKSCVVVNPSSLATAEQVFGPLAIPVVTNHRFLGGFLGDASARSSFVQEKVNQWVLDVHNLS